MIEIFKSMAFDIVIGILSAFTAAMALMITAMIISGFIDWISRGSN